MDLREYRESDQENERTSDLMCMIHEHARSGQNALDIGARDGHFSKLLVEYFQPVFALDLEKPSIQHKNVTCVQGDVTNLDFPDNYFDFVFCAEVLEHIPGNLLEKACSELSRVSKGYLLIGVPYKQDIRVGRTTCYSCGEKNPPWGHVNSFDEKRLKRLFCTLGVNQISFVGKTDLTTNFISSFLMDKAGNPYGTYTQEEPCIYCGNNLVMPPERTLLQKVLTKTSFYVKNMQKPFSGEHPNWIHVLFEKNKE